MFKHRKSICSLRIFSAAVVSFRTADHSKCNEDGSIGLPSSPCFPGEVKEGGTWFTQGGTALTAKSTYPRKAGSCRLQLCLSAFRLLQLGTAQAGGGCPPLAARPLFLSLRGWRAITSSTEAGSGRQYLGIDSTKYETAEDPLSADQVCVWE